MISSIISEYNLRREIIRQRGEREGRKGGGEGGAREGGGKRKEEEEDEEEKKDKIKKFLNII